MNCFEPEVLSRWLDGVLPRGEAAAIERHVGSCALCRVKVSGLRAASEWVARAGDPGRACLSAEEMAAVLEGAEAPAHVRTCPRCAAELAALRPRKRPTRRITLRPENTGTGWFVAAAAVMLAVVGLVFLAQQKTAREVARTPEPEAQPDSPPQRPAPPVLSPTPLPSPAPAPAPRDPEPFVVPPPKPVVPQPAPQPEPKVEEPATPAPKPVEPAPAPRTTVTQTPVKKDVPLALRAGALSAFANGKWTSVAKVEEGMALRSEGKTSIEFAKARVTFDASSHFTLSKDEVALADGGLSLEAQQGSLVSLVLSGCRIQPMAAAGRVLVSAKADRVVVEEGAAKWQEIVLHQGVEHQVVKEKLEPQKKRTLPAAARPRELPLWKPDFKDAAVRTRIRGRIDQTPEYTHVVSVESDSKAFYQSIAGFTAPDERGFFALKPNAALRFRYFLSEAGTVQLVVKNGTKDENFNLDLDPVVRQWTTITIPFKDIPVNQGGNRALRFEAGDKIWSIGWFVGKPGSTVDLYIDQLEVLELER